MKAQYIPRIYTYAPVAHVNNSVTCMMRHHANTRCHRLALQEPLTVTQFGSVHSVSSKHCITRLSNSNTPLGQNVELGQGSGATLIFIEKEKNPSPDRTVNAFI